MTQKSEHVFTRSKHWVIAITVGLPLVIAVMVGSIGSPPQHVSAACTSQRNWSYTFSGGLIVYHNLGYLAYGDCLGDKGQVTYYFGQSNNSSIYYMYQSIKDWECGIQAFAGTPSIYNYNNNNAQNNAYPGYCGIQADSNAYYNDSHSDVWNYQSY
jgi:hypothetical protein